MWMFPHSFGLIKPFHGSPLQTGGGGASKAGMHLSAVVCPSVIHSGTFLIHHNICKMNSSNGGHADATSKGAPCK